ncbi:hypothetical protein CNY89_30170, partial [Amaricoccus sp. HAR-UPW-R2A-40]
IGNWFADYAAVVADRLGDRLHATATINEPWCVGWRNRDIGNWFADYAAVVADRLGDRLHATATINEPWCV